MPAVYKKAARAVANRFGHVSSGFSFWRSGVACLRITKPFGWCFPLMLTASFCGAADVDQLLPECAALSSTKPEVQDFTGYQGRVLLIDFWATWCPPCRKSMPFLNSLRNELGDQGFEVIAVNLDEETREATRYLASHPVDYPILFDPRGECPQAFAVETMPSSYFVGRKGRIRFVHHGYRESDRALIREKVLSLLEE